MPHGRLPDPSHVDKIVKWGPCKDLSEVHAFLGTIGVCRIFIANFAKRANALVNLTCKDVPFDFGPVQLAAQADLKEALLNSPALRPTTTLGLASNLSGGHFADHGWLLYLPSRSDYAQKAIFRLLWIPTA